MFIIRHQNGYVQYRDSIEAVNRYLSDNCNTDNPVVKVHDEKEQPSR